MLPILQMRTLSLQRAAQHHTGLKWQTQVLNFNRLPPKSMVMILTLTLQRKDKWAGGWTELMNRSTKM